MSRDSYLIPREMELCSGPYLTAQGSLAPDIQPSHQTYIAAFCLLLGLQTVCFNGYVMSYYRDKRDGVFPMYYFVMTLCNGILGVDAMLHTLLLVLYSLYLPNSPTLSNLFNYLIFIIYTLTTTARNSKLVYNTILITMRAVKYCSPGHVFSKKTSAAATLLFPICWMLFLAAALNFHFSLPAEVNMQQYIYYPETNTTPTTKLVSFILLYILPLSIILASAAVCVFKRGQKYNADSHRLHKLRAEQHNRETTMVQVPTYGQSKVTDLALTALLLACYLPYVIIILTDIAWPDPDSQNRSHIDCTMLFMTGVILPFMNSAFDPVIFIVYNSEMSDRICLHVRAALRTCYSPKRVVRFEVDHPGARVMTDKRAGSMCVVKRWDQEPDVIEYKNSDTESDSSLESFQYTAKKHKSRRYR